MNNKKNSINNYIQNFSKKNNNLNVNVNKQTGPTIQNRLKSLNIKQIAIIIGIIIGIIILIYIIISVVNYYNKKCYIKKSLTEYMFDFKDPDPCIQEDEPVISISKQLHNYSNNDFDDNEFDNEHDYKTNNKTNDKTTKSKKENKMEVFHISNQDYTYDQAKCKCESYDARLATKSEVTNAYNDGAHWCTYGWTEKQSAFYPVQKCEWDVMTETNERLPDNEKKFCGMPGLNGGFFPNPEIKFGVNCYGVKPIGELSKAKDPYCEENNFCKLEQNYQASHKLDTDDIVGFNNEQWNADI
jgi:hypothetical protein